MNLALETLSTPFLHDFPRTALHKVLPDDLVNEEIYFLIETSNNENI